MARVAVGRRVGPDLRESFLQVREALARAVWSLTPRRPLWSPTNRLREPRPRLLGETIAVVTRQDLGVDVQWDCGETRGGHLSACHVAAPLSGPGGPPESVRSSSKPFMGHKRVAWRTATCRACVLRPWLPCAAGRRGGGRPSWSSSSMAAWWLMPRRLGRGVGAWWARACEIGPAVAVMPLVRVKGGVLCELSLFSPLVLIGNHVPKGGGPPWETCLGQKLWLTFSTLALILFWRGWRSTAQTLQA